MAKLDYFRVQGKRLLYRHDLPVVDHIQVIVGDQLKFPISLHYPHIKEILIIWIAKYRFDVIFEAKMPNPLIK